MSIFYLNVEKSGAGVLLSAFNSGHWQIFCLFFQSVAVWIVQYASQACGHKAVAEESLHHAPDNCGEMILN